MLLYLLRHANADTVAESDDARPLSQRGIEQAERAGRFCEAHEIQLSVVLTSPLRRAHETARIVAAQMRADLQVVPWLASGMSPVTALDELKAFRSHGSVMIVGHEPDFSALAAHLLGLPSPTQIHIRKASLTLIEIDVFRAAAARLEYTIPCKLM